MSSANPVGAAPTGANTTDAAPAWQLVVIDMQQIFRDTASVWCCPRYDEALANVARLAAVATREPVYTRFVRDAAEHGAWRDYYDRWPSTRLGPEHPAWHLAIGDLVARREFAAPTFSKWGAELQALPEDAPLLLTGVATDCCVLATALDAADAGRRVLVAADACAGQSDAAHEQTLELLDLLAPMVTVTTATALLAPAD